MEKWKKYGLIALVAGVGLAIAIGAKAATGEVLITDHDKDYDYKFSGGRWYTKKKNDSMWLDMQNALTPENYNIAVTRLTNFLNAKA